MSQHIGYPPGYPRTEHRHAPAGQLVAIEIALFVSILLIVLVVR